MSCDRVLPAIHGNDRAGDAACAVADQERRQSADVIDVDQLVLGRSGGLRGQQFIEVGDPAGGSGADRARARSRSRGSLSGRVRRRCSEPRFPTPPSPGPSDYSARPPVPNHRR